MSAADGAGQVFAEVVRISQLDDNGYPAVGAPTFTTNQLVKATFTPALETGVDLVTLTANADIGMHYKHGDMPKYYTMDISVVNPDPVLHQLLAGGTVYTDNSAALGSLTGTLTATGQITLGTLPAGTYGYRMAQYNQYGTSASSSEFLGTVASGSAGTVIVSGWVFASGAVGAYVYGRLPGGEQLMGSVPNIGSQATSAASGTGTPVSLDVTALTSAVPIGTTFQIAGDTNTPNIVFTTTLPAGVGALALNVSVSQSITTTIVAGDIVPVFVDNGTIVPNGQYPTADTTAGPGNDVGWQSPALGIVGNPNGVSIELWGQMILNGSQTGYLPFNRWVFPSVRNLCETARDFGPDILANMYSGQAFENPNWGAGPFGDFQFDSSRAVQYARAARTTLPVSGLTPTPATA
jgi:hypothetical protein